MRIGTCEFEHYTTGPFEGAPYYIIEDVRVCNNCFFFPLTMYGKLNRFSAKVPGYTGVATGYN